MDAHGVDETVTRLASMSNVARRKVRLRYLEGRRQRIRSRTLTRQSFALFTLAIFLTALLWLTLQGR
jgi:hypothetical protein